MANTEHVRERHLQNRHVSGRFVKFSTVQGKQNRTEGELKCLPERMCFESYCPWLHVVDISEKVRQREETQTEGGHL